MPNFEQLAFDPFYLFVACSIVFEPMDLGAPLYRHWQSVRANKTRVAPANQESEFQQLLANKVALASLSLLSCSLADRLWACVWQAGLALFRLHLQREFSVENLMVGTTLIHCGPHLDLLSSLSVLAGCEAHGAERGPRSSSRGSGAGETDELCWPRCRVGWVVAGLSCGCLPSRPPA